MCLGIPGEVLAVSDGALRTGRVAFGGVVKDVCLAYVPEAGVGDFVIVHAGFAIARLDRERAREVFRYLDEVSASADEEAP